MCPSQPVDNQCYGWTSPCGSYWLQEALSNNHQETLKKKGLLLTGPENYVAHLGSHSEAVGRQRAQAWGSAFIGVQAEDLGFHGLTLHE